MKLYHGSNMAVYEPQILVSDRKLDFGSGFYLTSSLEQAERWAELTTERRGTGVPTITVYEFDETRQTGWIDYCRSGYLYAGKRSVSGYRTPHQYTGK